MGGPVELAFQNTFRRAAKRRAQNNASRFAMPVLAVVIFQALLLQQADAATQFSVDNTALNTAGGVRFQDEIGNDAAVSTLQSAKDFILAAFSLSSPKAISAVTLVVEDIDGVAYTVGTGSDQAEIHLSARYVGQVDPGDTSALQYEITGVLYHESTHVWQNNNGDYNNDAYFRGVIEGTADYIRLTAGYPASTWTKQAGGNWYDGYSTTAYFLDWIDQSVYTGFVNKLNEDMTNPWTNDFFQEITGQTVDQLWAAYQATF